MSDRAIVDYRSHPFVKDSRVNRGTGLLTIEVKLVSTGNQKRATKQKRDIRVGNPRSQNGEYLANVILPIDEAGGRNRVYKLMLQIEPSVRMHRPPKARDR